MKKLILLSIIMFFLTGCTSIKNDLMENILNDAINSKTNITNINRLGYKYYKPKGLVLKSSDNYNAVFASEKYNYYLYVDIISYYHKVDFTYNENYGSYYSKNINFGSQKGYIEINNYKNDEYLVEIMYNYAKIEVIVLENDIKDTVATAMSIITSITYNDSIISKYLSSNEYNIYEENFDIFKIVGSNNYLEFTTAEDNTEGIQDPDYIK